MIAENDRLFDEWMDVQEVVRVWYEKDRGRAIPAFLVRALIESEYAYRNFVQSEVKPASIIDNI